MSALGAPTAAALADLRVVVAFLQRGHATGVDLRHMKGGGTYLVGHEGGDEYARTIDVALTRLPGFRARGPVVEVAT